MPSSKRYTFIRAMHVCVCAQLEARAWLLLSALYFETGSGLGTGTRCGTYCFSWTVQPASPQDPLVSVPSSRVTKAYCHIQILWMCLGFELRSFACATRALPIEPFLHTKMHLFCFVEIIFFETGSHTTVQVTQADLEVISIFLLKVIHLSGAI